MTAAFTIVRSITGTIAEPQWSRDGRSIYILQGRGIYAVSVPVSVDGAAPQSGAPAGFGGRGGRGVAAPPTTPTATTSAVSAGPRRINFTVQMAIDRPAERKQVFEEAWRTMKNRFYDPKMHGVNWAAAEDKYESLLEHVADNDELHNVIMEMIGELNASHTGGGGLPGELPQEVMQKRNPGFTLAPDSSGYYKVESIYRKGPADYEYMKIAPGNFVLAVNGKELKTSDNYWQEFNVLPSRKLEFLLNSKPSGGCLDHCHRAANGHRAEQSRVQLVGGESQVERGEIDQRRNRLPAH